MRAISPFPAEDAIVPAIQRIETMRYVLKRPAGIEFLFAKRETVGVLRLINERLGF